MMRELEKNLLWIGNISDARNSRFIYEHEIRLLVELAVEEQPVIHPRDLICCRFPIVDGEGNDPGLIRLMFETILQALQQNMKTLIYCSAGISRSPTVAMIALAIFHQIQIEESLKKFGSELHCDIHPGLFKELSEVSKLHFKLSS